MNEDNEAVPGIEQIMQEVRRICDALGLKAPEAIQLTSNSIFSRTGLSKDNSIMTLYYASNIEDYRDQISWILIYKMLKERPNCRLREPFIYDIIIAIVATIYFTDFLLVVLFVTPLLNDIVLLLALALTIGGYLTISYRMGFKKIPFAQFVADAMLRAANWTENEAEEYVKSAHQLGFWMHVLLSICFAIVCSALILQF